MLVCYDEEMRGSDRVRMVPFVNIVITNYTLDNGALSPSFISKEEPSV